MSILSRLYRLIFTHYCSVCGRAGNNQRQFICTACQMDLPLTYDWLHHDNELADRLWTLDYRISEVASMMHYTKKMGWRNIILELKYYNMWHYGQMLGRYFGRHLGMAPHFGDIDAIIPVPLHPLRRLKRGYNQSEQIAIGISYSLGCPVETKAIRRHRHNPSQTHTARLKRWANAENLFSIAHPERLAGRHLLLVDDILTTGATITSLATAILDQVEGVRVSIVTLGYVDKLPRRILLADPLD